MLQYPILQYHILVSSLLCPQQSHPPSLEPTTVRAPSHAIPLFSYFPTHGLSSCHPAPPKTLRSPCHLTYHVSSSSSLPPYLELTLPYSKNPHLIRMLSSHFTRRVSFDNYQPPQHTPAPADSPSAPTYFFPTTSSASLKNPPRNNNNSEHPHQPTSILKPSCSSINDHHSPIVDHHTNPSSSSPNAAPNSSDDAPIGTNYSLQPPDPVNNIRKKSYSEMSDNELLALDAQFNIRSIDFQKDYGFNVTPRLSSNSFSNSDKDFITGTGASYNKINTNFKNLSPNAILKEYPTKPIITKNSICVSFRHSNLKMDRLSNDSKFYLLLLSNKSSSLSALNYCINNILTKGDTLVICCSLSTTILGNDKSHQLDSFIFQFICLILNYLGSNDSAVEKINENPFNITFEFFKSVSYFTEVTNLYQPSLIIIGSNNEFTRSTSITNKDKKLLSVIVVGNDHANKNKVSLPSKEVQEQFNKIHPLSDDIPTSTYATVASLFNNLNDPPSLGITINSTPSTVTCAQPRRKSMLDVLNADGSKLSKSISRANNNSDHENVIDEADDDDTKNNTLLLPPTTKTLSRSSFGSIENPNKPLIGHAKEKQDLFEKYNRRLSAVNVTPQVVKDQPKDDAAVEKKNDSKKFFKWFKY